jgi:hypothetical protein
MRIPALAILAMATASAAPSARAQTYDPAYPVCLQIYQGWNDYYFECGYTSLAQCNMSASAKTPKAGAKTCAAPGVARPVRHASIARARPAAGHGSRYHQISPRFRWSHDRAGP